MRAIVFDFDGLVLETELPEYRAWQEIYEGHGASLPLEEWVRCIGSDYDVFNPYDYLEEQIGRAVDRDALRDQRDRRHAELIRHERVLPGVLDCLEEAAQLDLRVAVCSSSPRRWVEGHLERLGLRERFGPLVCREDAPRVKPDPALYLRAAETLGVEPREAVALEDSPNGVRAAKRAGYFCAAVPSALLQDAPFDEADLRIASLAELSLAELVQVVRK